MQKKSHLQRFMQCIPIRWRLALVSLGLLILLLSALGVIISFIAEQTLVTNEVNVLRNEAQVAFKGVTKDLHGPEQRPFGVGSSFFPAATPGTSFKSTAEALVHSLASPGTNAAILTTTGTPLITNDASPFTSSDINVASNQVRQIIGTDTPYLLTKDSLGVHQLVVFIPLVKSYHTVAILQVSTSTAPIDDFLTTFHLLLFLGIVCTFGLAVALTFPLVGMALRPLVEIERTSRRIAQGELSIRIEQPLTDDEIGRLARSFNAMVARLETAFQRQKRFVGDVSHELRTPLTALSGSLEMLLLGADRGDPEVTRRLARGMFAEMQRLHRMVEDLLALTRLDEGKLTLRKGQIVIESLLQTVCAQGMHLSRGQRVRCVLEPDLPSICAESQVELRAWRVSPETVALTVCDNGQGIVPAALPYVFDRFYRADPARCRSSKLVGGSGLGLAIAKELVEAQGGSIEIWSELGKGTSVTLRFPALARSEQSKRQRLLEMSGTR